MPHFDSKARSLALLNFGQSAIFSVSLAAIMLLAADEIMKGVKYSHIIT